MNPVHADRGEVAGQVVPAVTGQSATDVARDAVPGEGEEGAVGDVDGRPRELERVPELRDVGIGGHLLFPDRCGNRSEGTVEVTFGDPGGIGRLVSVSAWVMSLISP
jgi:hypothetical protein